MKLNNKGFAISGIIYAIMFLFIIIIFAVLGLLGTRKLALDKYKKEVSNSIENNEEIINVSKIDKSGASTPILDTNMIPVIYDGANWIKATFNNEYDQNWYNYNEKKWANAVLVKENKRELYKESSVDTIIEMEDILAFYVWIPRFRYKLFNAEANVLCSSIPSLNTTFNSAYYNTCYASNDLSSYIGSNYTYSGVLEQQIEIIFEKNTKPKSLGTHNNEYLTHPAFTFGDKELSGIWVGKFEMTGTINNVTTLPNNKPLQGENLSTIYSAVLNMSSNNNIYGLTSNIDSHLIKNMDWGAVSYLTYSMYGLCDNGICNEIGKNDYYNLEYKTGCGSSNNQNTCIDYTNASASTTNNIYGIYDMSGGEWEYVMGNMKTSTNQFNIANSGFIIEPNNKYYDSYNYSPYYLDHSRGLLGDATRETMKNYGDINGTWYLGNSNLPYENNAWILRGGSANYSTKTTMTSFGSGGGTLYTSRIVLTNIN